MLVPVVVALIMLVSVLVHRTVGVRAAVLVFSVVFVLMIGVGMRVLVTMRHPVGMCVQVGMFVIRCHGRRFANARNGPRGG